MTVLLAGLSAIMTGGLLAFGLAQSLPVALIAYGAVDVARGTLGPLFDAWVNRGIPSAVRATVLSSFGQMDAIGQLTGGPLMGIVARRRGIRAAIVLAGIILSPVLALYARAYRQEEEKTPELA
jgi:DHA3 family tetracycline resistance protein-like MFS transporter